jgi:hypothetical protein
MSNFGDVTGDTTLTRSIHISGNQFRNGAAAPTDVIIGTSPEIPALHFDATGELVSAYVSLPPNMDRTKDLILRLHFSLSATETDADTLDFTCDYTAPLANSTGDGIERTSTQVTGQTTVTTANGLAIGDMYTMDITFPFGDATNPLASAIALAFELHLTNVTEVGEIDLVDGLLIYEALH